ncbi:GNAT family N-acetyltransferase [Roseateles cellulosilyticus]|uniref:GNAT family N-acetyltransferase n=1 Tax=Pelomonas cellulosilytica TaxID=2906762 RepID=A0ABS8XQZ7_9BURK|nr:GNAT family N-acetyltransferase [Pelomonas sp. P8]MCE4553276.1 GNAT family N-acetyltransferase [Pelomonas sp. P8]
MPTLRVHDSPAALPREAWNRLLDASPRPTPFMRHEYLQALCDSGSAVADTGWQPMFLGLWDDDRLLAACPAWLKSHSYGEYVFDWAWADAYRRHGLPYYPKLLVAVPFTPVPGSRLLAVDDGARELLAHGLRGLAKEADASSLHVLFGDEADQAALAEAGCTARHGVQFHWTAAGDADFTAFLARLHRDKRKKIQQEQRRVREAGVVFEAREGRHIQPEDWDFFYRCYQQTYREHRSTPYLSRDFFARMAGDLPEHWLLFTARRGGERVATSLIALDPARRAAFGRYWGAVEHIPNLHFDACYYQPLAWCIDHGYQRFEGGAQGEHKMARGLLPTLTASSHWLAHPAFVEAVNEFLAREGQAMSGYMDELNEHAPYKLKDAADAASS